jgi:hypothetical protein
MKKIYIGNGKNVCGDCFKENWVSDVFCRHCSNELY